MHAAFASPGVLDRNAILPRRPLRMCKHASAGRLRTPQMRSAPVRARDARTGEQLLVSRAAGAAVSGVAPLVLCPECHAAFNGAALVVAARVRCSLCAHEFVADPASLYVRVGDSASTKSKSIQAARRADQIRCAHFNACSGCEISSSTLKPPAAKRIGDFMRHLGYRGEWKVVGADSHGWRTFAKLAVRRVGGRLRIGLFSEGSHDVVAIDSCAVHAPEINAASAAVAAALEEVGASAFCEQTKEGLCRYVLFSVQRHTRRVQLTLVWNARSWKESQPHAQRVAATLWRLHGRSLLHSVWFNWNTSLSNCIVHPDRDRFYRAFGEEDLVESVLGHDMYFSPYVFRQANLDSFEKLLLPELLRYIPPDTAVAEFCAGMGLIGLTALKHGRIRRLVASELNPTAEELFWKSLRASRPPAGKPPPQVSFTVGSDEETREIMNDDVDIVIVDPPRAGLSEDFLQALITPQLESRLKRIIYVSCGFEAFRWQAEKLVNGGQWKLVGAHGYVVFPGVDHVEVLAVFDRVLVTRSAVTPHRVDGKLKGRNGKNWSERKNKGRPVDTTKRKWKDAHPKRK